MTPQQTRVALALISLFEGHELEFTSYESVLGPATDLAQAGGITTPLGIAMFWDCALQQGLCGDRDSLVEVWKRARPRHASPIVCLTYFLHERRRVLLSPCDATRRATWPKTITRLDVWESLMHQGAWDLATPLPVETKKYRTIIR